MTVGRRPAATRTGTASSAPDVAAGFLRRRTLRRALHANLRWIGGAVGWPTMLWLTVWVFVALLAAAQSAGEAQFAPPSALVVFLPQLCALAGLTGIAALLIASRFPPFILDPRDVVRLGLTPVTPGAALAWPRAKARVSATLTGAAAGGAWALLAATFGLSAPWAWLAGALLGFASVDLAWTAYSARQAQGTVRGHTTLLSAVLTVASLASVHPFGLLSAAWSASPLVVVTPVVIVLFAHRLSRSHLTETYPPQFVAHSHLLGQLRAARVLTFLLRSPPDPQVMARLRAQLLGRPGSTRPTRFLPAPAARFGTLGAVAWRSALHLYRQPRRAQVAALLQFLGFITLSLTVTLTLPGKLLAGVVLGALVRQLLGPPMPSSMLPLSAPVRTLSRVGPGAGIVAAVAGVLAMLALVAGASPWAFAFIVAAGQLTLALVVLEKAEIWAGFPARNTSAANAAALAVVLLTSSLPPLWALLVCVALVAVLLRVPWP